MGYDVTEELKHADFDPEFCCHAVCLPNSVTGDLVVHLLLQLPLSIDTHSY